MRSQDAPRQPNGAELQRTGASTVGGLPREIVGQACKRLAAVVIPIGLLALVLLLVNLLFPSALGWSVRSNRIAIVVNGSVVVLSGLMLLWINRHHEQPEKLINAALFFEIAVCFAIAHTELHLPAPEGRLIGGISIVCVLIVLFPMLIPTSLKRALVVGLMAASTGPLAALMYTGLTNHPLPGGLSALSVYLPNYLAVGLIAFPVAMLQRVALEMARVQKLGSYDLHEKLGYGGMGEVWRAEHQLLRRPAAVKLISPSGLASEDPSHGETLVRRFEREAQATADLKSPHTVQLYDYGITHSGTFYYVMELLDGFDLDALVKRFGPVPAERAAHLLLQLCDSLWDAHQSGLVHRDVKPANVYVCRHGHRYDYVKVLDFGLVKQLDEVATDTTLTGAGMVTGTPAFMAPEVVRGETYDARADLYSVGCVGYWLITGELVFDRPNAMQTLIAHAGERPIPPSQRSELEIPPALERVLLRCLEKDPADRYQTARELAEALARCVPVGAWSEDRAARWWTIHEPTRQDPPVSAPALSEQPTRQLLPDRELTLTAQRT